MVKSLIAVLALALAGCAGAPRSYDTTSPCAVSQASYECQIEQYSKAGF